VAEALARLLAPQAELREEIEAGFEREDIALGQLAASDSIFWTWRILEFADEGTELTHMPLLRLANYWSSATDWAPPTTAPDEPPHITADDAANALNNSFWAELEFVFWSMMRACGLRESEPSVGAIPCLAPLFFIASPSEAVSSAEAYARDSASMLAPVTEACLESPDPRAHGIGWGVLRGRVLALRREAVDDIYRPLYLLLPVASTPEEFEQDVGELVGYLTDVEFSLSQRCDAVSAAFDRLRSQQQRWSLALESLARLVTEGARLLSPRMSSHADSHYMLGRFRRLNTPIVRMQASLQAVHSEASTLSVQLGDAVDMVDDSLRSRLTYAPVTSSAGVVPLYESLIHAYPSGYLRQPIESLVAAKANGSEAVVDAFRFVLDDANSKIREVTDRRTQLVGLLIGLAAASIALPTILPDAAIRAADFAKTDVPQWLSIATATARSAAVLSIALILVIVAWRLGTWLSGWLVLRPRFVRLIDQLASLLHSERAAPPAAVLRWRLRPTGVLVGWIIVASQWSGASGVHLVTRFAIWLLDGGVWRGAAKARRGEWVRSLMAAREGAGERRRSAFGPASEDEQDEFACVLLDRMASELIRLSLRRLPGTRPIDRLLERAQHGFHSPRVLAWGRYGEFVAALALLVDLYPDRARLPRALCLLYWKSWSSYFGCTFISQREYEGALERNVRFRQDEAEKLTAWLFEPENYLWTQQATPARLAAQLRATGVLADASNRRPDLWTGLLSAVATPPLSA